VQPLSGKVRLRHQPPEPPGHVLRRQRASVLSSEDEVVVGIGVAPGRGSACGHAGTRLKGAVVGIGLLMFEASAQQMSRTIRVRPAFISKSPG
jgi:hypothetical protein